MARILVVHGISNQYRGESELRSAWYPAIEDGLKRAGHVGVITVNDCYCPFYGDLFRKPGHLGAGALLDVDSVEHDEYELVLRFWESAAQLDSTIPGPSAFDETLARFPRLAERALTALARSKFFANVVPLQILGDLRQTYVYLNDAQMRRSMLAMVTNSITADTRVVIGHSLGSVIAYEAVNAAPYNVSTLITLGSPLGIRNVIFDKLTPPPGPSGKGIWPRGLRHWTNIAATGDIVAAEKKLAPFFDGAIADHVIDSGWDSHSSTRYLNNALAGEAIWQGL